MVRRLIVNADDFGLTTSVSEGVIDAFRNKQVSSTTLLVNTPGTEEAVGLAEQNPGPGVGLHFNLTEGRPLTSAESLTDENGQFWSRGQLLRKILTRAVSPADITSEFIAQLDRAEDLGITPTHIDSHQHVHMAPAVFAPMFPVLHDRVRRLRLVMPPRMSLTRLSDFTPSVSFKNGVLRRSATRIRKTFGGLTNDRFVSLHLLPRRATWTADEYRSLALSGPASSVTEMMVHPYAPGNDLTSLYRHHPNQAAINEFLTKCHLEHQILAGSPVFDPTKFQLISFDQLG